MAAHNPSNRLGQAARPARRRINREQEVLELNSNGLCGMKEKKKKVRSKRLSLGFPPRGNVKNKDLILCFKV